MKEKISFLNFCEVLENISRTTKRLEIQEILTNFLKRVIINDIDQLVPTLYLCTARIYPEYLNIEMGIGDHMLQMAVAEATGLSVKTVQQKLIKSGDLGTVAMENRVKQLFTSNVKLSISDVFLQLRNITKETSKKSTNSKRNIILSTLSKASLLESKYLIRLMEGSLKIGLALQTVLICLSYAFQNTDCNVIENIENYDEDQLGEKEEITKNYVEILKDAYNKLPDFDQLVKLILLFKIENLPTACKASPGIPLKPMLAQPQTNMTKALAKVVDSGVLSEFKYDGERVQIHFMDGKTKVFSRNSEDITEKYPDIAALKLSEKSFIIDGEAVAFENGKILPFQILSTRKRKNVDKIDVQVCVFAFDILFYDSEELLKLPLKDRRKILFDNFKPISEKFYLADFMICESEMDIEAHFKKAIQSNCEGIMLKSLESHYRPAQRTNSWVKIKKDYLDNLGDSMDLVVMGAFYGKGKRTGAFGGFLLGVYNDEEDKYEACCKIGTGFSDEDLQRFYELFGGIITSNTSSYIYNKNIAPDVWVEPKYVWEVKAASLSLSQVYTSGSGTGKGISLRFPRFIRQRDDKSATDASTSNQLLVMYNDSLNAEEEDEFN